MQLDRPIFFLGTQGGGLTLLSRVLRRHPAAVSVTGDHRYWNGADELHRVAASVLPNSLRLTGSTGLKVIGGADAWLYACDEYLPLFRRTPEDATAAESSTLVRTLQRFIYLHAGDANPARFVDKSQSYTVKLAFVSELLRGHDPHFVLSTRNPYAMCLRAATRVLMDRPWSHEERIQRAAQHWNNSIRCAVDDAATGIRLLQVRFEDFLEAPERTQRQICDFVGLPFMHELLPGPNDRRPLGGGLDDKWYPLKPAVNSVYWERATPAELDIIEDTCGETAARMGYSRPNL